MSTDADTKAVPFHPNGHTFSSAPVTEVEVAFFQIGEERVPYFSRSNLSSCCYMCGDRRFTERVTEEGVWVEGDPCPVQGGLTTVIVLRVPSGKILVDDDLRPLYDGFDNDNLADYNSVLGQAQVIGKFAEQGCAFGPVGNSCPGVWKTGQDTYMIGRMPYVSGDEEDEGEETPTPPGSVKVAWVCTDLWAYSIVDFEDWKSKGGDPEKLNWTQTVVDVTPGTYEFTFHGGEKGFDGDADHVVFADFKRIA